MPNGKKVAAEKASVVVTDRGFINLDIQMHSNVPHIFSIGDIVGTHAGNMIGEIALAIEMGADAVDIGKTIHPHPALGEASAWRGRLLTAAARMCRRRRSEPK